MIKFADTTLDNDIIQRVARVFRSGQFINGKYCQEFAEKWADYCNTDYCTTTSSGSSALTICLRYLKSKNPFKNLVIVPSYSFAATVHSVVEAGLFPIYSPVDKRGLINQEIAYKIIKSQGQGLVGMLVVHLYGQQVKIEPEILKKVPVIEDACQAHGIKQTQGLASCFSFYPAKNLGACGDAGAICTNNAELSEYSFAYSNYGDYKGQKYKHNFPSSNMRMDEIQAFILLDKLKHLDKWNSKRKWNAFKYFDSGLETFTEDSFYHQYPILVDNRDKIKIKEFEIGSHYPYTLPEIVPSTNYWLKDDYSHKIAKSVLTIPIGPHLTEDEVQLISRKVKKCL